MPEEWLAKLQAVLDPSSETSHRVRTACPPTGEWRLQLRIERDGGKSTDLYELALSRSGVRLEPAVGKETSERVKPVATATMTEQVATMVFTGKLDVQAAFLTGQIRVQGDWQDAPRFAPAFKTLLELASVE